MNDLIQVINSIYPLGHDFNEYLSLILRERTYRKKDFLLKAGHVCRTIWFVRKGCVRCFYNDDDLEVCSWFMKEGDWVISVDSFFKQKPSYESIQALEDCNAYSIEYDQLQYLYKRYPEFNVIGRVLTERYYALSEERLYSLRMKSAAERYNFLRDRYGEIVQRIPSKYIASYLGITEETLSRIRARKN